MVTLSQSTIDSIENEGNRVCYLNFLSKRNNFLITWRRFLFFLYSVRFTYKIFLLRRETFSIRIQDQEFPWFYNFSTFSLLFMAGIAIYSGFLSWERKNITLMLTHGCYEVATLKKLRFVTCSFHFCHRFVSSNKIRLRFKVRLKGRKVMFWKKKIKKKKERHKYSLRIQEILYQDYPEKELGNGLFEQIVALVARALHRVNNSSPTHFN